MTTLNIDSIVRVKATIAPSGAMRREFGRTLLITDDDSLSAARRVGVFADLEAVAELFEPDTSPYQAARTYFSQSPYPKNLVIGRWVSTTAPARLIGGAPSPLLQLTGSPTVLTGTGTVADLVNFHGRATVLTGTGTVADLVNFHGRATVVTGTGTVADLVNFHGRATVVTGTGTVADLVNFHGRATVLTGTGTVADLVNFHGRATVLTGTGTVADLVNFHGRATVLTGTGTVASLTTLQGITSGSVTFLGQTVTGLDFSSDTDLDGVASTLQTTLRATSSTDLDNVEVVYDSTASAFVVTLPLDSSGVVPTVSAAFTGDDADELGLDTATIVNGVDAIVSGTVTFLGQTLTGLDFSAVTDYDGVAAVLQTALRATSSTDLDNVEVVYDSDALAFVVTLPLDSSGVVPTASAAFTGDDADELGLDTATIVNGVDAIVSGTVTFLSETLTGLDFSAVTDYDEVASVLQTALRAISSTDLDNVEVVYDSDASVFVVTIPLASNGAATSVSAAFTGSESDELGLDTATIVDGVSAIQSGSVTLLGETFSGLDFSAVTDYDGVASVLQDALRATSATSLDEVEVVYDGTAFVVTIPLDSSGAATSVSAAFTGTESDELGLDTATIVNGVDAIVSGTVTFLSETLTGLDFSAVTDYDEVASVLQTALRAISSTDLDNVEVVYDSDASVFVVTIPLASNGAATSVSAAFTGSESDELGLDTATIVDGVSAIQSGSVTLLGETFSGLDFSAVTDYDGVASVLQDALRATSATSLDEVEVVYDGTAFVVTIPLDSSGAATSVSAAFTGSESDELGLDTATIVNGVDTITSGTLTLHGATASGLDFSNVSSHDDVASVLQTALRAASETDLDQVEVSYVDGAFVITVPLDSDGSATSVIDPFTGDSADEFGLDTVDIDEGVDGIGNGSISWQSATVAGLDFTDATSYADVASTLQTALRAAVGPGLSTATVLFNASRQGFAVALGFDSSGDPYTITDLFSGADADSLGLDESSATQLISGEAAEPIEDAMVSIRAADHSWYFVAVDSQTGDIQSRMDLAAWVDTEQYLLGLDILGQEVLVAGESSSLAALLSNLEYERTFLVWSESDDNKALSLMARLSSVNFEGANTLITAKFKSLPGTQPDILNTAGQAELDRKRVNYYTRFGLDSIFAEGYTLKPGAWIDVRYWLDWIVGEIQTSVYNLLRTHPTRLPQTDPGIASIKAEINGVCEAGIRNGGIAPGRVSEAIAHDIRQATGNLDFSGRLTRGYLVYSSPVATLTDADRAARRSPPFRVWLTGSGAVHFATIELTFAN